MKIMSYADRQYYLLLKIEIKMTIRKRIIAACDVFVRGIIE